MYSTVLLENVPQFGLQIYLLIVDGGSDIVCISMTFSVLSIIISILTMISQRSIVRTRDFVSVEFDVKGAMIVSNMEKCKNLRDKLQLQMSSLVGIEKELVEIIKPKQIKQGIKLIINFHINNTRAIDMNIAKDITEAYKSGQIANIIKDSWKLASAPNVENLKCSKHESKERRDNTEVIKVRSESMKSAKHTEGNMDHMNTEIAMSVLATNHEDNGELPPHIEPVQSTAGELVEDSDSDEYKTRKQTLGSNIGNEARIRYSMNSDGDKEVIGGKETAGNVELNDNDIIDAVNHTAIYNNDAIKAKTMDYNTASMDQDIVNVIKATNMDENM